MIPKLNEKARVIGLRLQGLSYKEIKRQVAVGYGSIARWCQGIVLSPTQHERLLVNKRNSPLIQRKREEARESRLNAAEWAGSIADGVEPSEKFLIVMAAMLYWAEGRKLNERGYGSIELTNTDSRIITIMMSFFRKVAHVSEERFRIIVRMGNNGDVEGAQRFWSDTTGIPRNQFQKPELLILPTKSKSLRKYPHGMCRIIVHSTLLARKMDYLIKELYKMAEINKVIEVLHGPS